MRKNETTENPKVKITMPNLLMIPVISIICSIIKVCHGVDWNWITVLITAPMLIYLGWSTGFILIVLIAVYVAKIANKYRKG